MTKKAKAAKTVTVKEWRTANKLSQRNACELLGCSRGALGQWESGAHKTPPYILLAIKALEDGHTVKA